MTANTRSNAASPTSVATQAPRATPIKAGASPNFTHANGISLRRWKLVAAPIPPTKIAIRLVPFAIVAGNPMKIRSG